MKTEKINKFHYSMGKIAKSEIFFLNGTSHCAQSEWMDRSILSRGRGSKTYARATIAHNDSDSDKPQPISFYHFHLQYHNLIYCTREHVKTIFFFF